MDELNCQHLPRIAQPVPGRVATSNGREKIENVQVSWFSHVQTENFSLSSTLTSSHVHNEPNDNVSLLLSSG